MRLTVIGTGYVGLNTVVAAAYIGHDVVCVDKDPAKVDMLQRGQSPIHEQGLDELLAQVGPKIRFTADTAAAVHDADVIIIAVGTPSKENGEADIVTGESLTTVTKPCPNKITMDREYGGGHGPSLRRIHVLKFEPDVLFPQ